MLNLKRVWKSRPKPHEPQKLAPLLTPWGEELDNAPRTSGHPHPQFARKGWLSLDGAWEYAIVEGVSWQSAPAPQEYDGQIHVPFSPEAPLSGVGRQLSPAEALWYRRSLGVAPHPGMRAILHFEAVDHACRLLVNKREVGTHTGAYLPFSYDITDFLTTGGNTVELCVCDPSDTGTQLRGKQRLEPSGIWYSAQSGIWQSVWLEEVPDHYVRRLSVMTTPESVTLGCSVSIPGKQLEVQLLDEGTTVAKATILATRQETEVLLRVSDPHPWTLGDPHLYQLRIRYGADEVESYCALRTVCVRPDENGVARVFLNGDPVFLRGVLDQGYWPDGLMSAPSDAALEYDILAAQSMGFNMIRKHIKVEADRWYWHCDRLGMLVWQDMPTGGGAYGSWETSFRPTLFSRSWHTRADDERTWKGLGSADAAYRSEWRSTLKEMIQYLGNHPCIIGWTLFNEGWGQFDAAAATELARTLDPARLVSATSGWYDQGAGDFWSVHNYFRPLTAQSDPTGMGRASVISEFGGLTWHVPAHSQVKNTYGYADFDSFDAWRRAVRKSLADADGLEGKGLAGYVYTQLVDVEEESNGLLTCDRRINKLVDECDEH